MSKDTYQYGNWVKHKQTVREVIKHILNTCPDEVLDKQLLSLHAKYVPSIVTEPVFQLELEFTSWKVSVPSE